MGSKVMEILLVAMVMVMVILVPFQVNGESNCQNEIASLSTCYSYISGSSSSNPSHQCCDRIENVYKTNAECLCSVLNEDGLNRTRVLELPNACNLHLPSASHCHSPPAAGPPPPPSGYSTKIRSSSMLSVLSAALCAGVFLTI